MPVRIPLRLALVIVWLAVSPAVGRAEQLPIRTYTTADGLAADSVYRVVADSRGFLWFCTNDGLSRFDGYDMTTYTTRDGALWCGTEGGLYRLEAREGKWTSSRVELGTDAAVEVLAEDGWGGVWVATIGEMRLVRPDVRVEALSLPGLLRGVDVDSAGRMWVASSRGGLARVDEPAAARPRFVVYTVAEGLSSDNVFCVVADAWGRVYAGTTHGVDRIDLATGAVTHYTSADGLPKHQIQCAFRDRRDSLRFGSLFGLARFDPEPDRRREPPRTFVTGLRVAGVARPVSPLGELAPPSMELGPGENNVSLDFLGLGTSLGEELRYKYWLEGADADWSPPSAERTVTFANLAPGTYRLLVRAVDADGVASPEPAEVAFTVLAPVWRRWWFLALAGSLAALAAYGIYRYRVTRLLEVERVRTRIATDLHDDIGSNLTRIAFLSEVGGLDGAQPDGLDLLRSIARISRESVSAMNDIVWAIDPNRDSFRDLARRMRKYAEETFVSLDVALEFSADDDLRLGNEMRRQIYLIFKESINNAVRHSGCARAEVSLHVGRRRLALEIADDGRGFDPSVARDGNGLRNIRRRAAAVGGKVDVRSEPGGGTRICLSVPLRHPA